MCSRPDVRANPATGLLVALLFALCFGVLGASRSWAGTSGVFGVSGTVDSFDRRTVRITSNGQWISLSRNLFPANYEPKAGKTIYLSLSPEEFETGVEGLGRAPAQSK